jgi:hypothetical protein
VARRFDEALRPLDLTSGQFSLDVAQSRRTAEHRAGFCRARDAPHDAQRESEAVAC